MPDVHSPGVQRVVTDLRSINEEGAPRNEALATHLFGSSTTEKLNRRPGTVIGKSLKKDPWRDEQVLKGSAKGGVIHSSLQTHINKHDPPPSRTSSLQTRDEPCPSGHRTEVAQSVMTPRHYDLHKAVLRTDFDYDSFSPLVCLRRDILQVLTVCRLNL